MTHPITVTGYYDRVSLVMSKLDDAMQEHMACLVFSEKRPFCYQDFFDFEVDGKIYGMKHGTFRNKIARLMKAGEVEFQYNSGCAFYSIMGHKFGKSMTLNPAVVKNFNSNKFYKFLQNVPLNQRSVHNVRLKFKVSNSNSNSDIWQLVSSLKSESGIPTYTMNETNYAIHIPGFWRDNVKVRIFIQKTNTVEVIFGCSLCPIRLDYNGTIKFFTLLARTEEKLNNIIENCYLVNSSIERSNFIVPNYLSWIVTRIEVGRDGLTTCSRETFNFTTKDIKDVFVVAYSKDFANKKKKARLEKHLFLNKTVGELLPDRTGDLISQRIDEDKHFDFLSL